MTPNGLNIGLKSCVGRWKRVINGFDGKGYINATNNCVFAQNTRINGRKILNKNDAYEIQLN